MKRENNIGYVRVLAVIFAGLLICTAVGGNEVGKYSGSARSHAGSEVVLQADGGTPAPPPPPPPPKQQNQNSASIA